MTTTESLTTSGGLITPATRELNVDGDGFPVDSGYGIWPAATNLITNGGFETNFTGWVAENESGGTSGRSTDASLFGSASAYFIATTPADNAGIRMTTSVAAASGSTFTASAFIRSLDTTELALRIAEYDTGGNFLRLGAAVHAEFTDDGEFTRITATATMGASTTQARLFINTWGSQSAEFYVDGIQFEAGPIATPYIETDGSTESRTAGRVQMPVAGLFTATQGAIATRWRRGAASTSGLFSWRDATNDEIRIGYDGGQYLVSRATLNQGEGAYAIPVGAASTTVFRWVSDNVGVSHNGGVFSSNTNAATDVVALEADIGGPVSLETLRGNILWFATFAGTLTDADAAALNALGDTPPTWAQLVSSVAICAMPTALWRAEDDTFIKASYAPDGGS